MNWYKFAINSYKLLDSLQNQFLKMRGVDGSPHTHLRLRKARLAAINESHFEHSLAVPVRTLCDDSTRKPTSHQKYTKEAGIEHSISPHKLRHFLFTWMKRRGVDDALIQPYSGHENRSSLEIYSKLSLSDCQEEYENQIKNFPI